MEGLLLPSEILGQEVSYSVLLPADYYKTPSRSYPVLYLFHCIGGDSSTGIEYCDLAHLSDSLVRARTMEPMIVVMPDLFLSYGCDTYDSTFRYESMLIEELMPEVEKTWRTDGRGAAMGFSMGGFAAMSLALRHPDLFCATAALSPSVRTDAQYMSESPQEGWDSQWGRIFGGLGKTGEERLTDYYRARCPLHLLEDMPAASLQDFGIFLTTGNREGGSLAESNEALHQVMSSRAIPHRWSVSDGGHDFAFWRKQLPDALRFVSCTMEQKPYKARQVAEPARIHTRLKPELLDGARLYRPEIGYETTRKYPYICVFGANDVAEKDIIAYYTAQLRQGGATPIAFLFIDNDDVSAIRRAEAKYPALRQSQRMRSAICFGSAAAPLQTLMMKENLFTNVVFAECSGLLPATEFAETLKKQKRYPRLILASRADFPSYSEHADLHVALKSAGLTHTHYAYEQGSGNLLWHFPEWLSAINNKFHD